MLSELSYEENYVMLKVISSVEMRISGWPDPGVWFFFGNTELPAALTDFRIDASPLHL